MRGRSSGCREVEPVDAEAIHLPVALVDEALALAPQRVEIVRGHGALRTKKPSLQN